MHASSTSYTGTGDQAVTIPYQSIPYMGIIMATSSAGSIPGYAEGGVTIDDTDWTEVASSGSDATTRIWYRYFDAPSMSDPHRSVNVLTTTGLDVVVLTASVGAGAGLGIRVRTPGFQDSPFPVPTSLRVFEFTADPGDWAILGLATIWARDSTAVSATPDSPLVSIGTATGPTSTSPAGVVATSLAYESAMPSDGSTKTFTLAYTGAPSTTTAQGAVLFLTTTPVAAADQWHVGSVASGANWA